MILMIDIPVSSACAGEIVTARVASQARRGSIARTYYARAMSAAGRYAFAQSGMFYEPYELELAADGTFKLGVGLSDPAGWAGSHTVGGRWEQTEDAIRFTSDPPP